MTPTKSSHAQLPPASWRCPGTPSGRTRGDASRAELYLEVDTPERWHARALAAGAVELSPLSLRGWGQEAAYSLDPDGHVLAFARARERSPG